MGTAAAPDNTPRARCIFEPRGDQGLEGYSQGELYRFEYRTAGAKDGKPYYRVWPASDEYYETCSERTFAKYFEEIPSKA